MSEPRNSRAAGPAPVSEGGAGGPAEDSFLSGARVLSIGIAATGLFTVDGNRTEAEKSYKALMVLGSQIFPAVGLPPTSEDAR